MREVIRFEINYVPITNWIPIHTTRYDTNRKTGWKKGHIILNIYVGVEEEAGMTQEGAIVFLPS